MATRIIRPTVCSYHKPLSLSIKARPGPPTKVLRPVKVLRLIKVLHPIKTRPGPPTKILCPIETQKPPIKALWPPLNALRPPPHGSQHPINAPPLPPPRKMRFSLPLKSQAQAQATPHWTKRHWHQGVVRLSQATPHWAEQRNQASDERYEAASGKNGRQSTRQWCHLAFNPWGIHRVVKHRVVKPRHSTIMAVSELQGRVLALKRKPSHSRLVVPPPPRFVSPPHVHVSHTPPTCQSLQVAHAQLLRATLYTSYFFGFAGCIFRHSAAEVISYMDVWEARHMLWCNARLSRFVSRSSHCRCPSPCTLVIRL